MVVVGVSVVEVGGSVVEVGASAVELAVALGLGLGLVGLQFQSSHAIKLPRYEQ